MSTKARRWSLVMGAVIWALLCLVIAMSSRAAPDEAAPAIACKFADLAQAKTAEDRAVLQSLGSEWLSHARVCSIGGFTVVVPDKQTVGHDIQIYKGRKPVFERSSGEAFVFSPTVPDDRGDQMVVNIWHPCEGEVTRLFYDTRGPDSSVTVGDLNFDGLPDQRLLSRQGEIREAYGWYQGEWHLMKARQMQIAGQWQPVHFEGSGYRLGKAAPAPAKPQASARCATDP